MTHILPCTWKQGLRRFLLTKKLDKPDEPVRIFDIKPQLPTGIRVVTNGSLFESCIE